VCRAGSGRASSVRLSLTVGLGVGSVSGALSVALLPLSLFALHNVVVGGYVKLCVLSGVSFARYDISGRLASIHTSAEMSSWVSDSLVLGLVARGVSRSKSIFLSQCIFQLSTTSFAITYDNAKISCSQISNLPRIASVILLVGRDLITGFSSLTSRLCSTTFVATKWISDSAINGLHQGDISRSFGIIITAGTHISATTSALSSLDLPYVSSICGINGHAARTYPVVLLGHGLGKLDSTVPARIGGCVDSYCPGSGPCGGTVCEYTRWASDSTVVCKLPYGTLPARQVVVTCGSGIGSTTRQFSYDLHTISASLFPNLPAISNVETWVVLVGSGFKYSSSARVGVTSCRESRWISDTRLNCKLASGLYNANATIAVTVFGVTVTASSGYQYLLPFKVSHAEYDWLSSNMKAAGNFSRFYEIAMRPWVETEISLADAQAVAGVGIRFAGGFGVPCNDSVPLLALPGMMIETVPGVTYQKGFGVSFSISLVSSKSWNGAPIISPIFKISGLNVIGMNVNTTLVTLRTFPSKVPDSRRASGIELANNSWCVAGKEWILVKSSRMPAPVSMCPSNTKCRGDVRCSLQPHADDSWFVIEVNSSLDQYRSSHPHSGEYPYKTNALPWIASPRPIYLEYLVEYNCYTSFALRDSSEYGALMTKVSFWQNLTIQSRLQHPLGPLLIPLGIIQVEKFQLQVWSPFNLHMFST
jgi:hypothetical protein